MGTGKVVWSVRDRERLAELEQELADLRSSARSESIVRRVNELVGGDFTASWGFGRDRDRTMLVEVSRSSSDVPQSYFETLSKGLESGTMGFLFSLRVPEPEQRNRPMMFGGTDFDRGVADIERRWKLDSSLRDGALATLSLMQQHGIAQHVQLRALLCDGSLVIGYLNTLQPRPFSVRQRQLFTHAAKAIRERLVLDRRLSMASVLEASLDVALDALPRVAFVLDKAGRILHANSLGELALLDAPGLAKTFEGTHSTPSFDVVPISVAGTPEAYLAVKRKAALSELAAALAKELGLSNRAHEVLCLATAGEQTKVIATRLGIAENTVEYHLGVIFRRLHINSRAELFQVLLERALS